MKTIAVMSQPLRQKEAAQFLGSRPGEKVVITRFLEGLDSTGFPEGTIFRAWSSSPKPPPSARAVMGLGRLKRWARSGSSVGLRVERWARSIDWRLRYVDRFYAAMGARGDDLWDLENPDLVAVLREEVDDPGQCTIAVFDLFDLPAVIPLAGDPGCSISVR
jgi:hypothetical protein